MQNRPLRPFEQGAHLHVLDWAHDTARYRFQAAGAAQVKAAAKACVDRPDDGSPPDLPALEAALTLELRKLYALGHATVRSELDHQATRQALPVGLSTAPEPPHLRMAKRKKGKFKHCGTCKMYDLSTSSCWGYGNWPVKPNEVCDSYARDPDVKQLAIGDQARDPGRLRARARLAAQSVAHAIWHAVRHGKLNGIQDPKALRQLGRDAGNGALSVAASGHAGSAINAGRRAAAELASPPRAQIVGARYTSVLDKHTCGPCRAADTGQLVTLDSPEWVPTPNPACESTKSGTNKCRCIHVYQLASETVDESQPAAA